MFMKNSTNVIHLILAAICLMLISCSDNSSGPNESDAGSGEGTINVSGDFSAEHDGISQYIGLKSDGDNFINLTLQVSEHPIASAEVNDFSFSIRMAGNGGPFTLETGEYEIGQDSDNPIVIVSYANRMISDNTVTYGTTPNSSGTVTILSITSTSIEAVYNVTLDVDVTADMGSVNITGELNAECHSTPGSSC